MNIDIRIETRGALLDGRAPKIIQANLDKFVTLATLFLKGEVQKRTPQGVFGAQGGLLGSIQTEVIGKGTPAVKGVVVTTHSYAEVIEKGRAPGKGMPPKGVMVRWLEVKLGLDAATAASIEFVVRRKIGVKGFEGKHMFEKAVTENQGRLDQMAKDCGLSIAVELNQ